MDLNSFSSAIIGAVIAGSCTLWATHKSFDNQRSHEDKNEKKLIKGLLQSIHDEIETVFDRYQTTMGMRVESLEKDDALTFYYPLISDYFTVYNGNSFLIGRIPNNNLRKQIIRTYTLAKGTIDSFRMNNDLLSKWEYAEKLYAESQLEVHKQQAIAHYQGLKAYTDSIKEGHKELKEEVSLLLKELNKNGVIN